MISLYSKPKALLIMPNLAYVYRFVASAFFFLIDVASNGGSELFISTDDKPESKTMISGVDGGFPSNQYEYDRCENKL